MRFFDACTRASALPFSLSLSLSLVLVRLHPFAALVGLVSSAPLQARHPPHPVFSSRTSSFFLAGLRAVLYNRRGKFSSGDFDGDAFSLVAIRPPLSPPSSLAVDRYPLCANIRGDEPGMKSFGGFLLESACLCVCVHVFAVAKKRKRRNSTVITDAFPFLRREGY